ncbi:hypothetical protein B7W85_22130 [Allorhizobium ampelinum]|nr:hypothetical protein BBL07_11640 [Agrobacterium vitis]OVE89830.1 hypothetical protein B7W85_22130 [Allorhizobium ampelinum]
MMHEAVLSGTDLVGELKQLFEENGWSGIWRNGVFDYPSIVTVALTRPSVRDATLLTGGPTGRKIDFRWWFVSFSLLGLVIKSWVKFGLYRGHGISRAQLVFSSFGSAYVIRCRSRAPLR